MQQPILSQTYYSDATFDLDRLRYLEMIRCRLYNLLFIISSTVYSLHFGKVKVLIDANAHSENGLPI
jgi:hypothetical protein